MGTRFFKETIRDVDLRGRTVLVRVDYNVPLTSEGDVSDDLRIRASIPTIQYLVKNHCKVVILSHLQIYSQELVLLRQCFRTGI